MEKQIKDNIIYKLYSILFFIIYLLVFYHSFNNHQIMQTNIKSNQTNQGRIFLCTLYNNEAEFAYIYLWRLYDYIDKFIIVTSNKTYSGHQKNITFEPFEENIKPYMDKVDIVFYNGSCNRKEYPLAKLIWCIETSQRDYAKYYIEEYYNPNEKDLLIIADIDEILTREGLEYIKKNPPKEFYFIKGTIFSILLSQT